MSETLAQDGERQAALYGKIAGLIAGGRSQVRSAVNQAMVLTYWQIGQMIVEDEQAGEAQAEYGKAVLKRLSEQLSAEFGKGFDVSNLRHMRRFYLQFPNRDALRPDLSWTHYRLLLKSEKNEAVAKYSVLADGRQIFASKYRLVLPTEEELAQGLMAIEAEIEEHLRGFNV